MAAINPDNEEDFVVEITTEMSQKRVKPKMMTELYQKHATMDTKREQMRLLEGSMNFLPTVDNESDSRQKLIELAQTLPIEKVEQILKSYK